MKLRPPRTQRWFRHVWDEIHYRCGKATFHLYICNNPSAAKPHVARLRFLLTRAKRNRESIIRQNAKALLAESDSHWSRALNHRKKQIAKIVRLYASLQINDQPTREFALWDLHKFEILRILLGIQKRYARHAARATATAFDKLVMCFRQAEEPENPGKTRGSGREDADRQLWCNRRFYDWKHAHERKQAAARKQIRKAK